MSKKDQVFKAVQANPGQSAKAYTDELGFNVASTLHDLRQSGELISPKGLGGVLLWFEKGADVSHVLKQRSDELAGLINPPRAKPAAAPPPVGLPAPPTEAPPEAPEPEAVKPPTSPSFVAAWVAEVRQADASLDAGERVHELAPPADASPVDDVPSDAAPTAALFGVTSGGQVVPIVQPSTSGPDWTEPQTVASVDASLEAAKASRRLLSTSAPEPIRPTTPLEIGTPVPSTRPACVMPGRGAEQGAYLYAAYNSAGDQATAGLSWDGKFCPAWADLPFNVREKWNAAAAVWEPFQRERRHSAFLLDEANRLARVLDCAAWEPPSDDAIETLIRFVRWLALDRADRLYELMIVRHVLDRKVSDAIAAAWSFDPEAAEELADGVSAAMQLGYVFLRDARVTSFAIRRGQTRKQDRDAARRAQAKRAAAVDGGGS